MSKRAYIAHIEVRNESGGWDTWERIAMLTQEQADECHAHSVCMMGIVYCDRLMVRQGGGALMVRNARLTPVPVKRRWWQFWRKG